jgi:hypothetical protein
MTMGRSGLIGRSITFAAVILASIASISAAAPATAPATAPTTAPARGEVQNPLYVSWSKCKPGSSITIRRGETIAGHAGGYNFTQTLLEVSPEKVVLETVLTTSTGEIREETRHQTNVMAKVQKGGKAGLPADFNGTTADKPAETVAVGGKSYPCNVVTFDGEVHGVKISGTIWECPQIPGDMAKTEMKMDIPNKPSTTTTLLVTVIDKK